jgi:hypothetical protein
MVLFDWRRRALRERYRKVNVYGSGLRERDIESTQLSSGEGERLWFRDFSALPVTMTHKPLK